MMRQLFGGVVLVMKSYLFITAVGVCFSFTSIFAQEVERFSVIIGDQSDAQSSVVFSGILLDKINNQTITGATIKKDRNTGVTSDIDGAFQMTLPSGEHQLEISYLGYKTIYLKLAIYSDGNAEVFMSPTEFQLQQVVISEQSDTRNIESVISGVERLSVNELKQKSQLLGELDVLRSIQTLSGVTSAGDGASGFNVRGGNADENLILQDDGLIINPAHTLGFFSLFHPDLISSVELFKGNQPAYYGGRLSSVLQVNLREGDDQKLKARGGVGMAASRISVEGPIKKGKSSFIVGGRISYMDYLLNLVKNINVKRSKTIFYDLTLKADARISPKTKVGISSFISSDEFQFGDEVNFDYQTKTATGYVNHLFSDNFNSKLILNVGDYDSSLLDIQGNDLSRFSNGVSFVRAALRNFLEVRDNITLLGGLEYNLYSVSPGRLDPEDKNSTAVARRLDDEKGAAITPYLQLEYDITDMISIIGGLRYTSYSRLGPGQIATYEEGTLRSNSTLVEVQQINNGSLATYSGWEPRISANVRLNDQSSIKLGFNRGFQYLNQLSNTASATPIDLWKLSDTYIQPQISDNFNLGFFSNFANNKYESSIEVFYRDQKQIVEYKDFPDLLLNEFLEREVVTGIGRSYGVETNFKKSIGDFKFQINYTYSRSERRVIESPTQVSINQGQWYPSNYDKPHSFNLSLNKKTGAKTNLSLNFTYSTGRPITAPVSNFGVDNILNIPIFSERNQFRIPDYHRLDLAYTIGPFGKGTSENTLTFSVYNLYSRKNAYSVFFRQKPFQSISVLRIATLGSIFPAITYNFNIK